MKRLYQRKNLNSGDKNSGVSLTDYFILINFQIETRTSGSQDIWNLLRNACIEDHATAVAMIEAVGVQMPQ